MAAESAYEHLLCEKREDGVLLVTLNRPAKFNALCAALLRELECAIAGAREDEEVGAIVVTGSPETKRPVFAAGADIGEMSGMSVMELRAHSELGQRVFTALERCRKPVIAAVNGLALGGGLELAMACHLRWAAADAKVGQPEINLGLITGFAGSLRLPRLVGRAQALQMLLSGDQYGVEDPLCRPLFQRVLPQEELMEETLNFAAKLAAKAPLARAFLLELLADGSDRDLESAQRLEADRFGMLASTDDTQEGLAAFLEKRTATWKGR